MSEPFFLGITSGYSNNSDDYEIYAGIGDRWGGYPGNALSVAAQVLAELFKEMGDPRHPLTKDKKALAVKAVQGNEGVGEALTKREELGDAGIGIGGCDIAIDIKNLKHIRIFECEFVEALQEEGGDESDPADVYGDLPSGVRAEDDPLTPYEFAVLYERGYLHFGGEELDLSALKKYGRWNQDDYDEDDDEDENDDEDEDEDENEEDEEEGEDENEGEEDDDECEEEPRPRKKAKVEVIDMASVTIPKGVRNTLPSDTRKGRSSIPVNSASTSFFETTLGTHHVTMGRKGIQIDGQDVKLTRCELSIFRVLAAHPNVMVSAEELQKEFFLAEEGADTTNVRVHIGALRHKIESACPDIAIRTKYGGGYILTCGGSGEE